MVADRMHELAGETPGRPALAATCILPQPHTLPDQPDFAHP
jgi:hypothetical protein